MTLPVPTSLPPMEATSVADLPVGEEWQYEPKWDGFRCLAHRDGTTVHLMSKSGKPLGRYFPEIVEAVRALEPSSFVLDGELVVPDDTALDFDALLQRIHPAASRVAMLAETTPALFLVFDLLVDDRGRAAHEEPLLLRRPALEEFAARFFPDGGRFRLSPCTTELERVQEWLQSIGGGLDGLIAKRRDLPYRSGTRDGMQKIKQVRTADCVIGGFRYAAKGHAIGSFLLGLYDEEGLLHHVGFTSSFTAAQKPEMLARVEPLRGGTGFTGNAPGGPSRWATERSAEWEPVEPALVVEVTYDHFSGGRFRHGTKMLRWRPDKAPAQCTLDQVQPAERSAMILVEGTAARSRRRRGA